MPLVCQRCQHENAEEARFCLQCGTMLEARTARAPADPFIGKVLLGRYRVLGVLGEGGMGKVYLAEQKMGTATRNVAIKTLHPQLGADAQLIARFHRECETVVSLSHPNTVQFHDFGEIDQTLFIVMEYIEGESLAHVLERGAIEPARVDRILIQICGSLNEAHQRGVVHRDLKPENVLLTERGGQTDFVKVLDFGIAKRSEAEEKAQAKLTKQGMVLGTPPYMSPEQFSGQPLDARSDIYSLGVMTYEMLTGQLPFEAATPWEWATKHLTEQPTPLEAHAEGAQLPEHKKAAIHRALQKERDHRQATVLELMHEITGLSD
ncbi:MAG: serine/threonine-protein kinase, partial [Myxococcota bacterium]